MCILCLFVYYCLFSPRTNRVICPAVQIKPKFILNPERERERRGRRSRRRKLRIQRLRNLIARIRKVCTSLTIGRHADLPPQSPHSDHAAPALINAR